MDNNTTCFPNRASREGQRTIRSAADVGGGHICGAGEGCAAGASCSNVGAGRADVQVEVIAAEAGINGNGC